ncbi:MAG: prephenate dehydrogenase/arogenate dehydrogenase family protein [Candidatus Omnitrophota bacterium]
MKLFNRIGIVGLGLIGGSVGIAIKQNGLAREVIGVSRKRPTLNKAIKIKAIDKGFLGLEALSGCELIILCTPVKAIIKLFSSIRPYLCNGSIVTDVGSTKFEIVNAAKRILPKKTDFIGGHPLAGSEKRGIDNAAKNLFKNSLCLLTPIRENKRGNLKKIKLFWQMLGAKVKVLKPAKHDEIVSLTSHLPHLIAFSLMEALPSDYLSYGSSGLKDTTRIASSDPLLWAEIFLTNRKAVLKSVSQFQEQLAQFTELIKRRDEKQLFAKIKKAKLKRDKLP